MEKWCKSYITFLFLKDDNDSFEWSSEKIPSSSFQLVLNSPTDHEFHGNRRWLGRFQTFRMLESNSGIEEHWNRKIVELKEAFEGFGRPWKAGRTILELENFCSQNLRWKFNSPLKGLKSRRDEKRGPFGNEEIPKQFRSGFRLEILWQKSF